MRKALFLWSAIVILVLILILAFENILYVQTYFILFYQINVSTTIIILLAAVLGFLVGFFSMLYSYERRELKKMEEEADTYGTSAASEPEDTASTVAKTPGEKDASEKQEPPPEELAKDDFDKDDEVLG